MKIFILAVVLLALIITGIFISTFYIKNLSDELSEIVININKYSDRGDFEKAHNEYDRLYEKWSAKEKFLRAIVDHELVDDINIDMIELSLEIKYKQKEDINRECEKMLFKVKHIFEREELNAPNLL